MPSSQYPEHISLSELIVQSNEFIRLKSALLEVVNSVSDEKLLAYLKYYQAFFQTGDASWVPWITVDPRRGGAYRPGVGNRVEIRTCPGSDHQRQPSPGGQHCEALCWQGFIFRRHLASLKLHDHRLQRLYIFPHIVWRRESLQVKLAFLFFL